MKLGLVSLDSSVTVKPHREAKLPVLSVPSRKAELREWQADDVDNTSVVRQRNRG